MSPLVISILATVAGALVVVMHGVNRTGELVFRADRAIRSSRGIVLTLQLSGVREVSALGAGIIVLGTACFATSVGNNLPRTSEYSIRAQALASPGPEYPKRSLELGHQGVAVALVEVGSDGSPRAVTVLQAPDPYIANALAIAVRRWRFNTRGAPPKYCGKLTYYFRISRHVGTVTAGDERDK